MKFRREFFIGAGLILAAVILRIVNAETHWYNFAPIMAISLFSGAIFKQKNLQFILPLAAYLISDIYLQIFHNNGFYGISQFFVYGGMAMVVLLGRKMKQPNALKIAGFSIGGTLLFWIISNLGVFASGYYGFSFAGLAQTYLLAIPFYTPMGTELFANALIGDMIFSAVLFGSYYFISQKSVKQQSIA